MELKLKLKKKVDIEWNVQHLDWKLMISFSEKDWVV